jgi:uncharacterized membrane protein
MWSALFDDPVAKFILWSTLLVVLSAILIYAAVRFRGEALKDEQPAPLANELMSKIRELHSRGEVTDEEFRTIKTKLATRLQGELKDNGETG